MEKKTMSSKEISAKDYVNLEKAMEIACKSTTITTANECGEMEEIFLRIAKLSDSERMNHLYLLSAIFEVGRMVGKKEERGTRNESERM